MTHWLVPWGLLVVFLLLVFLPLADLLARIVRRRRVRCPEKDIEAEVLVSERSVLGIGSGADVQRWSILPDPDHVDCGKTCIAEPETRPAAEGAPKAV